MSNNSYTEIIYTKLKESIINCTFSPKELFTEKEVSLRFGSSKTPAREALHQLCIEGYLEKIPYKGYFIKDLSFNELKQMFKFREIIEVASIELAIGLVTVKDLNRLRAMCHDSQNIFEINDIKIYNDLNQKFHIEIAKISQNVYLVDALSNIMDRMRRALILDLKFSKGKSLLEPHNMILDLIEARESKLAVEETKKHIIETEKRIFDRIN